MEDLLLLLNETWAGKTLADLRAQALVEPRGLVYESLRMGPGNGRRVVLVVCATGEDWLSVLPKVFDFSSGGTIEPWEDLNLIAVVLRIITRDGFGYEDLVDGDGKRIAVALIATAPRSIEMLESILGFR